MSNFLLSNQPSSSVPHKVALDRTHWSVGGHSGAGKPQGVEGMAEV